MKIDLKPDGGFRSGERTANRGDSKGATSLAFSVFVSVIFSLLFSYQIPNNQNYVDHSHRQDDGQQIPTLDVVDQIAVAPKNVGNEEADQSANSLGAPTMAEEAFVHQLAQDWNFL
jgi:hypothetical protein